MNHNIRYEVRDIRNLEVSIEITKTTNGLAAGFAGPDGEGVFYTLLTTYSTDERGEKDLL